MKLFRAASTLLLGAIVAGCAVGLFAGSMVRMYQWVVS